MSRHTDPPPRRTIRNDFDEIQRPSGRHRSARSWTPATEEAIAEIANGTVAEATTAVGVTHQAHDAIAEISPRSRSEILRRASTS